MIVLLGWLAALVGGCISIPQLLRILRTRNLAGISVATWQLNFGVNLAWTTHGVITESATMWLSNGVLAVWTLLILRAFHVEAALSWTRRVGPGAVLGTLAASIELLLGPVAFAIAVAIPSLISMFSQLTALARSVDVSGASTPFYAVNVANQLLWLTWALLTGEAAVIITGSMAGALWTISLAWLVLRRTRIVGPIRAQLVDPTVGQPMPVLVPVDPVPIDQEDPLLEPVTLPAPDLAAEPA